MPSSTLTFSLLRDMCYIRAINYYYEYEVTFIKSYKKSQVVMPIQAHIHTFKDAVCNLLEIDYVIGQMHNIY